MINADKIVLNDGKIENIGNHRQLLKDSTRYKDLYIYQNEREKEWNKRTIYGIFLNI